MADQTEQLIDEIVPLAAELVGTVRDYGPGEVAAVLARVPDGRHDALAVVLAAMVDPDARQSDLLSWADAGPVPSRTFEPVSLRPERRRVPCPDCGRPHPLHRMAEHRRRHGRQEPLPGISGRPAPTTLEESA